LVNFHTDQAEGLRRMLGGPKHRVFTFLSATPAEDKGAMLVNLGVSLLQSGSNVLLVDGCHTARGIAAGIESLRGKSLLHAARRECGVDDAICQMPQGFGVAALLPDGGGRPDAAMMPKLAGVFETLTTRADIVVVDAELGDDNSFPLPTLASSEIVVQVSTAPESITQAYTLIKRASIHLGKRPYGVVVTGASDSEAQVVYKNMSQAANRYLSVKLNFLGSVPADEHLTRAARLGRAVVEAFPLAGASVAIRRLTERFTPAEPVMEEFHGISSTNPY